MVREESSSEQPLLKLTDCIYSVQSGLRERAIVNLRSVGGKVPLLIVEQNAI